ncbi:MAG TPA: tRNA 4-thiouridine(8) synthase ThiI [Spirochaetota bacterium]|nr:tRNA 4-thiouridine(8) synthase ThiI [Spirochaetota bacterium]HPF05667.1 tRNA 4-thiouridine(8) synthase ThiI [Spirochaetota bacterium]HPR36741.1 tRNA 4-thiouridine(8) synthase ThiI [Spirochaetota bacterium]HRX47046.1 tRNA 4-thiouridine(8) synthase ThiI [Spirochaetota bacterium]
MSATKGVLLYSGGLDSILAAKLLLDQGIDLTGLYCILPFYPPDLDPEELESSKLAKQIGLKLEYYRCDNEYIEMVKSPPHGHGKHINPCIDCKLFFIKKAAELMNRLNADFVASGEVVGQRPMSQLKHTLKHIEKESGLKGRLLRPLSAKILEPTIPEIEGKIDRNRLLDISGRGRKRQMELADQYGIVNYSHPAGGCLFTDRFFSDRLKDLFEHQAEVTSTEIYLLTLGRHFRINDSLKFIVSRNEHESIELEKLSGIADYFIRPEFKGPSAFITGVMKKEDLNLINSIISRYGKVTETENRLTLITKDKIPEEITAEPAANDIIIDSMRL